MNIHLRLVAGMQRHVSSRCLLCGGRGQPGLDLCPACMNDLPRNRICCSRCALPLPYPAAECGACLKHPPPWQSAWVPWRYAWPLDRLEARYKFSADLAAGRTLVKLWQQLSPPQRPQAIIPIPLHRTRQRQRGYDQVLQLARPLARRLHLPLITDVLQRRAPTAAQSELNAVARRRNVRGAFTVREGAALPAHVALLDDVLTTGATMGECTRVLRRAGVQRVDAWALARVAAPAW